MGGWLADWLAGWLVCCPSYSEILLSRIKFSSLVRFKSSVRNCKCRGFADEVPRLSGYLTFFAADACLRHRMPTSVLSDCLRLFRVCHDYSAPTLLIPFSGCLVLGSWFQSVSLPLLVLSSLRLSSGKSTDSQICLLKIENVTYCQSNRSVLNNRNRTDSFYVFKGESFGGKVNCLTVWPRYSRVIWSMRSFSVKITSIRKGITLSCALYE